MLIQTQVFESIKGGAQSYKSGVSGWLSKFCTIPVGRGEGVRFTEYGGFHISRFSLFTKQVHSGPNKVSQYPRRGVCKVGLHYIDLIRETVSYYVIHFQMAKAHKCPLAAVCMAVSGEAWKAVVLGSFDSLSPQTWRDCRKKLLNDRNGRRQLIVHM